MHTAQAQSPTDMHSKFVLMNYRIQGKGDKTLKKSEIYWNTEHDLQVTIYYSDVSDDDIIKSTVSDLNSITSASNIKEG